MAVQQDYSGDYVEFEEWVKRNPNKYKFIVRLLSESTNKNLTWDCQFVSACGGILCLFFRKVLFGLLLVFQFLKKQKIYIKDMFHILLI